MELQITCIECLVRRHAQIAREHGDPEKGAAYLREVLAAIASAPCGVSAPWLSPVFEQLTVKYYGQTDYPALKTASNALLAKLLPSLRAQLAAADDPLAAALELALRCNYIDYSALRGRVNREELLSLLSQPIAPQPEYPRFCEELTCAKRLVYLCDNAGEIFADALVAQELKKRYPKLELLFAVRGKPALNDALREDALLAGLDKFGKIIDNGSGISGTELAYLGQELHDELHRADIILAKGQGNFETMAGCGLNVYYSFLCKCSRFTNWFHVPQLTGLFVNERRLPVAQLRD